MTLVDPAATYIDPEVVIGADTLVHPGVHLRGKTTIGRGCEIEPGVIVTDCTIGDRVHLKPGSVLSESTLGDACAVGPMAHLRPGTVLAGNNKIGNFVETKKAVLGEKSQASHLTYLGDADARQKRQHRLRHHHLQLRRRQQVPDHHRATMCSSAATPSSSPRSPSAAAA